MIDIDIHRSEIPTEVNFFVFTIMQTFVSIDLEVLPLYVDEDGASDDGDRSLSGLLGLGGILRVVNSHLMETLIAVRFFRP